mmetsp:Transcript_116482/g.309876  ORF Transcript_116482/g.309876 Transcript_116482/m.309876 type:complete len:372 (-) Transcript_116482:377-1492(-)
MEAMPASVGLRSPLREHGKNADDMRLLETWPHAAVRHGCATVASSDDDLLVRVEHGLALGALEVADVGALEVGDVGVAALLVRRCRGGGAAQAAVPLFADGVEPIGVEPEVLLHALMLEEEVLVAKLRGAELFRELNVADGVGRGAGPCHGADLEEPGAHGDPGDVRQAPREVVAGAVGVPQGVEGQLEGEGAHPARGVRGEVGEADHQRAVGALEELGGDQLQAEVVRLRDVVGPGVLEEVRLVARLSIQGEHGHKVGAGAAVAEELDAHAGGHALFHVDGLGHRKADNAVLGALEEACVVVVARAYEPDAAGDADVVDPLPARLREDVRDAVERHRDALAQKAVELLELVGEVRGVRVLAHVPQEHVLL